MIFPEEYIETYNLEWGQNAFGARLERTIWLTVGVFVIIFSQLYFFMHMNVLESFVISFPTSFTIPILGIARSYGLSRRNRELAPSTAKVLIKNSRAFFSTSEGDMLNGECREIFYYFGFVNDCPRVYGYKRIPAIIICFPHYSKMCRVPCGLTVESYRKWDNILQTMNVQRVTRPFPLRDSFVSGLSLLIAGVVCWGHYLQIKNHVLFQPNIGYMLFWMFTNIAIFGIVLFFLRSIRGEFPFFSVPWNPSIIPASVILLPTVLVLSVFSSTPSSGGRDFELKMTSEILSQFIFMFLVACSLMVSYLIGFIINRKYLSLKISKQLPFVIFYDLSHKR